MKGEELQLMINSTLKFIQENEKRIKACKTDVARRHYQNNINAYNHILDELRKLEK